MTFFKIVRTGVRLFCLCSVMQSALATPFIPASGSQVLETLPSHNDPVQRELQQLNTVLAEDPHNVWVAVRLARRYVELWRDGGDPRYLGYAQAALGPWWHLPAPPLPVRVMRATLLQSTHQFGAALADLDAVVQSDRDDAQAWLTRATILQVLGDYPRARESCQHLVRLAPALIVQTCQSGVASLNGEAQAAYHQLDDLLQRTADASADIRIWVRTLLGEIAQRRGDVKAARRQFEQAMALGEPDSYLLSAYADFLLTQHEPEKVIQLLEKKTQVDALLLRYALALQDAGSAAAPRYRAMLAQRFDAARLRGDTIHQREQARFELELVRDPVTALKIARQNWQIQKEPADTRLLLQAAVAANDPASVATLAVWLRSTGLEDRSLAPLLATAQRPH